MASDGGGASPTDDASDDDADDASVGVDVAIDRSRAKGGALPDTWDAIETCAPPAKSNVGKVTAVHGNGTCDVTFLCNCGVAAALGGGLGVGQCGQVRRERDGLRHPGAAPGRLQRLLVRDPSPRAADAPVRVVRLQLPVGSSTAAARRWATATRIAAFASTAAAALLEVRCDAAERLGRLDDSAEHLEEAASPR